MRISDRHVFQHGALGGATVEECHHGSERVERYLERYGSHRARYYPELMRKVAARCPLPWPPTLGQVDDFVARADGRYAVQWIRHRLPGELGHRPAA